MRMVYPFGDLLHDEVECLSNIDMKKEYQLIANTSRRDYSQGTSPMRLSSAYPRLFP